MPSRTVRRARKTSNKSSRCSSMASAFSKTLITSSPKGLKDDSLLPIEEGFTFEDCKLEFQRRKNVLQREHKKNLDDLSTFMLNLRMSVPGNIKIGSLGSYTDAQAKKNASLDSSSVSNDTFLLPVCNSKITGDEAFKRPLARKIVKKTTKLPTSASSKFKTPDISSQSSRLITTTALTITPKMNPNTPMNMMRRPKLGEVAVSMTGSPLLVSTILHDELPTVTVPFADGRVFSIMPNVGTAPDDVPEFDETTKAYLKTLQDHLKRFCES